MTGTTRLDRCRWCGKRDVRVSEWEQKTVQGEWSPLCTRCANTRVRNPFNALLPTRRVGSQ